MSSIVTIAQIMIAVAAVAAIYQTRRTLSLQQQQEADRQRERRSAKIVVATEAVCVAADAAHEARVFTYVVLRNDGQGEARDISVDVGGESIKDQDITGKTENPTSLPSGWKFSFPLGRHGRSHDVAVRWRDETGEQQERSSTVRTFDAP